MAERDSFLAELFDQSFCLYQLSPLHYALDKPLLTNLDRHAHSLAKCVNRELHGGTFTSTSKPQSLNKPGSFTACTWMLYGQQESTGNWSHDFTCIHISLEFEKRTFAAFLSKRRDAEKSASDGCIHFPLLLTNITSPWLEILFKYLAAAFDTYIHPLKLSTHFLLISFDDLISDLSKGGRPCIENTVKDVSFTLDFTGNVAPSLKHLEITIRKEDLFGFWQQGIYILAKQDGPLSHGSAAFSTALREYIRLNLAMDLGHERASVSKLACGGFDLGKEGKIKLLSPPAAQENDPGAGIMAPKDAIKMAYTNLMNSLIKEAQGDIEWDDLDNT